MTQQRQNDESSSVQVAVRVRPMLNSETGSTQCIEVLRGADSDTTNIVRIGGESGPTFAFDEAFSGSTGQAQVYERRVASLVQSCMDGYNATCLAYGQTGSGKTHSMMGPSNAGVELHNERTAGVIPRALRDLFSRLEKVRQECSVNKENHPEKDDDNETTYEYEVRVQFLELYGEEIRDLLTPSSSERLTIRDVGLDGEPEIMGAIRHKVETAEDALLCLSRGMMRRVTGATAMNESSSRSHAILSVLVEQTRTLEEPATARSNGEVSHHVQHVEVKRSKFNFVDLAGSERQKRTQAEGQRLKEGIDINKGLLVLGNVISALGDPKKVGKSFVPYRDSKLTRLLKGSLGGNHKTLMIACVSPSSNNLEESLNCLRYANRAKNIQNNAVVNLDAGSRLVTELRQQVQALAADFLRAKQGDDANGVFSVEVLKALATGCDATGVFVGSRPPSASIAPGSPPAAWDASSLLQKDNTDSELERTREQLRQANLELLTTSEALHVTKAEKELYRLQVAATSTDEASGASMDYSAFVQRSAAYEKEISSLKEALRKASVAAELGITPSNSSESPRTTRGEKEPQTPTQGADDTLESPEFSRLHTKVLQSISHSDQLDAEEQAENAEIANITSKYLDDDEPDLLGGEAKSSGSHEGVDIAESAFRQTEQMEAHLLEISRSIDAKEELIDQLQLSQQKYAAMREFYENKLHEMEEQVRDRELEREELALELQKMEESNSCTKDLEERLKEKERHIAGLRKKQKELVSLTKVSSRNESEINRLRNDVVTMKQKKVELQKLISSERKSHKVEIQRLKKEAMQREREASKWKRAADKKAAEAEKAQQVAKARLDQVGQLRSKYKDAERQLRVRVVKRGVMEKAGLDPVIVGRRDSKQRLMPSLRNKGRPGSPTVDFDRVRGFLDQKIAEVGRKEAIADKLANEWEDHLELVSQRDALLESSSTSGDAVEALDVQIQYKEERIRQLARRLGKVEKSAATNDRSVTPSFLEDSGFASVVGEKSPLVGAKVAARVLFGMVVRERRRVASLARTASSLDEKAVQAEKSASAKEAAFRSYMEEEQHERDTLAQSQQEQILSLMSMVKEQEAVLSSDGEDAPSSTNSPVDDGKLARIQEAQSTVNAGVMVLANERINALQSQVHELQAECKALEGYKEQEAEAQAKLAERKQETDDLRKELNLLRSSLRQIRETLSSHSVDDEEHDDEMSQAVLGIVMEALHPPRSSRKSSSSTKLGSPSPRRPKPFTPRLKRHVELMHTSDSEEDEEVPDWVGDIMEDLAIIAEDKIPPSLRGIDVSPAVSSSPTNEKKAKSSGSVFDRLTNPDSFTGVQKQLQQKKTRPKRTKSKESSRGTTNYATRGQEERRAVSRSVTESLEKVVIPSRLGSTEKRTSSEDATSVTSSSKSDDSRSVFERLLSPSNYTGTHKERARQKEIDQQQQVEDEPDAVLDEILGTDSDVVGGERLSFAASEDDVSDQIHSKVSDYTQQDVFERLQRTTTQSYAVKHSHVPVRSPVESSNAHLPVIQTEEVEVTLEDDDRSTTPTESHVDHSEYYRQNVFERLQKTTTQAYAKKLKSGESK